MVYCIFFIVLVYPEKLKETLLLLNFIRTGLQSDISMCESLHGQRMISVIRKAGVGINSDIYKGKSNNFK